MTIKNQYKRLYVFTGKGGVGKTTVSLAFTRYLNQQGQKAKYLCFNNTIDNQVLEKSNTPHEVIFFDKIIESYIAKKLKSKKIASWITKTTFFKAMIDMVPGFSYIIYLRSIMDQISKDKDLTIVLDSPSSGHALTMFEAFENFQSIFQKGPIFDDIGKMIEGLSQKGFLKVNICSLPSLMSIHEEMELKRSLLKLVLFNRDHEKVSCFLNNCLFNIDGLKEARDLMPEFLKMKIDIEEKLYNESKEELGLILPHIIKKNFNDIVEELIPYTKFLI